MLEWAEIFEGIIVLAIMGLIAKITGHSSRLTAIETNDIAREKEKYGLVQANNEGHQRIEDVLTRIDAKFDAVSGEMHTMHLELVKAIKSNGK